MHINFKSFIRQCQWKNVLLDALQVQCRCLRQPQELIMLISETYCHVELLQSHALHLQTSPAAKLAA